MDAANFDLFLNGVLERTRTVLASKGAEYVPGEEEVSRFHAFNVAAGFNNETPERALWGMLTKHLVSLSDMVQVESTDYPIEVWDEKIGDAVNYLVLLWGITTHHSHLACAAQADIPTYVMHTSPDGQDDEDIDIEPTYFGGINRSNNGIGIEHLGGMVPVANR